MMINRYQILLDRQIITNTFQEKNNHQNYTDYLQCLDASNATISGRAIFSIAFSI